MRTRFAHRTKNWYWRKTGFGIVQQPYAPNKRQHYKGQPRNTRNFKNSKRKRFMLHIVKLVGMTRKFNELAEMYQKKMNHPQAAAYARAYHEIGQILRWQPDAIDAALDVEDWLPEPIE